MTLVVYECHVGRNGQLFNPTDLSNSQGLTLDGREPLNSATPSTLPQTSRSTSRRIPSSSGLSRGIRVSELYAALEILVLCLALSRGWRAVLVRLGRAVSVHLLQRDLE